MLGSLKKKFAPPKSDEDTSVAQTTAEPTPAVCSCGSDRWWQSIGNPLWRCESCQPPPSESLAACRCNPEPTPAVVVETIIVTCCRPWCQRCGSWRGREQTWSDGRVETKCVCCRAVLDDWPVDAQETPPFKALPQLQTQH